MKSHTFSRIELQSPEYVVERVEAYNVAIEALQNHESASGENSDLARRLRENLASGLERELARFCHNNDRAACGRKTKG